MYNRNSGQLSFRQGVTRAVGLPLDVIDKVGASMTESYHRNRQAVVKLQSDVLNLPDTNSEGNKKIIEQMTEEVKSAFGEYQKEGNWWNADDAVYDMIEKITADPRVKDLQQFSAQAAKIDKAIEESGASEYHKTLQRAINMKNNQKGIRNEDGTSNYYKGDVLPGNLDLTEMTKEIDSLIDNWKPDKIAKIFDSGYQPDMTTPDGFVGMARKYGKETIESVDPNEIRAFVTSYVMSSPKFEATIQKLAELDVFARTQGERNVPTSDDVTNMLIRKAEYDPNTAQGVIVRSERFAKETAKMDAAQKNKYLQKIYSDPDVVGNYFREGIAEYKTKMEERFKEDPNVYQDAYAGFFRGSYLQSLDYLVNKEAYTKQDIDYKIDQSNLNVKMYEKFAKELESIPVVNTIGQFDGKTAAYHLDKFEEITSELNGLNFEYSNSQTSDKRKQEIFTQMSAIKGKAEANAMYIEEIAKTAGITKESILDNSDNKITKIVGQFALKGNLSKNRTADLKGITDIIINNFDTPEKVYNEVRSKFPNSPLSDDVIKNAIDVVKGMYTSEFKSRLSNYKGNFSYPVNAIGFIGSEPEIMTATKKYFLDMYKKGDGTFNIIQSWDEDRVGGTNLGEDSHLSNEKQSKIKGVEMHADNIIDIEPLLPNASDDAQTLAYPSFRITIKDPTTNTVRKEIIQANTPTIYPAELYGKMVKSAVKATYSQNNPFNATTSNAAKVYAGSIGASTPVISRNNQPMKDMTLGNVISSSVPDALGNYPSIRFALNNGELDLKITKVPNTDSYISIVTDPQNDNKEVVKLTTASPYSILEKIGGDNVRNTATNMTEYMQISELFKLPVTQPKKR